MNRLESHVMRAAPSKTTGRIRAFYRVCVWLPLAVPALVAWFVHGLGANVEAGPLRSMVQLLLMSLLYGGVPYAALALWATGWIGGRSETEIGRLMVRAPLLMASQVLRIVISLTGPWFAFAGWLVG